MGLAVDPKILAGKLDDFHSFGNQLGRHAGIGRTGDGGAASLSRPFRINRFANVSEPQIPSV
jgi:hypothetical protein